MAERRMFSKSIVESAKFLKMPPSSQNLYFHLGMNADDDGIVEAYPVMNMIRANEDDLRVLVSKELVRVLDQDLVTYIEDWMEQNRIRPDRKRDSIHRDLLQQAYPTIQLLERKDRSDLKKKSGPSTDGGLSAQCSRGKGNLVEDRIGECSNQEEDTHTVIYQLDNETITRNEYEELISRFTERQVERVIKRILNKPYHGCLNVRTIASWCEEDSDRHEGRPSASPDACDYADCLKKLAEERPGD